MRLDDRAAQEAAWEFVNSWRATVGAHLGGDLRRALLDAFVMDRMRLSGHDNDPLGDATPRMSQHQTIAAVLDFRERLEALLAKGVRKGNSMVRGFHVES